ncbi:hypothetical protein K227x_02540 [Rubripirellula lacrimiformis]|uniref:Uncharacterized protein n=1 Tax=Rubripirellula lacrimiformis TaxID=1930273 RepID=A0A517N425_9BACT|nr:hypothetical protein K227x_02540 [Rubripirellula lacrimiformis]
MIRFGDSHSSHIDIQKLKLELELKLELPPRFKNHAPTIPRVLGVEEKFEFEFEFEFKFGAGTSRQPGFFHLMSRLAIATVPTSIFKNLNLNSNSNSNFPLPSQQPRTHHPACFGCGGKVRVRV